jgi:hypothetical protein
MVLPLKNMTCTKRRSRIISATWHLPSWAAIIVPPVPAPVPRHDNFQCACHRCLATMQDGMLPTRGVGSARRSVGSGTSVIGSSSQSRKRLM